MCCATLFTSIMTMVVNYTIIFIIGLFMLKFFFVNAADFLPFYSIVSCCLFVKGIIFFFSKLNIFIVYSLKDTQNLFMQYSLFYTSCLFSRSSDVHKVDIEYPQEICLPTFTVDYFYIHLFHK